MRHHGGSVAYWRTEIQGWVWALRQLSEQCCVRSINRLLLPVIPPLSSIHPAGLLLHLTGHECYKELNVHLRKLGHHFPEGLPGQQTSAWHYLCMVSYNVPVLVLKTAPKECFTQPSFFISRRSHTSAAEMRASSGCRYCRQVGWWQLLPSV